MGMTNGEGAKRPLILNFDPERHALLLPTHAAVPEGNTLVVGRINIAGLPQYMRAPWSVATRPIAAKLEMKLATEALSIGDDDKVKLDAYARDLEVFQYIVVDWTGFAHVPEGATEAEDLPCTNKNKSRFYDMHAELASRIIKAARMVQAKGESASEDLVGNSSRSGALTSDTAETPATPAT